jgi:hypothetical protein
MGILDEWTNEQHGGAKHGRVCTMGKGEKKERNKERNRIKN